MITLDGFAKQYDKFAKALVRRVKAYLKDPNAENVHRLRTATRRFQAASTLLPKTIRKRRKTEKAMERIRKLMKVNATVRDWDIVLSKLSTHKNSAANDHLIENLRKARKSNLEEAHELALAVQKSGGLRLRSRELSSSSLQKRYDKVVRRVAAKISNELPLVREDGSKIKELHAVRRDCKQLRYILEMSEFATPPKPLVALRSWQDLLGTIRDQDVMIDYLTRLKESPEIRLARNLEAEDRKRSYLKFVEASRDNPAAALAKG